jgi:hypothetical protein
MICFEVQINDEPTLIAGDNEISVLSAILTHVPRRSELELTVGGLISKSDLDNEHLRWHDRRLRVGDVVQLRIVESERASAPTQRTRDDPELVERTRRQYYESLRKEYEEEKGA